MYPGCTRYYHNMHGCNINDTYTGRSMLISLLSFCLAKTVDDLLSIIYWSVHLVLFIIILRARMLVPGSLTRGNAVGVRSSKALCTCT